MALYALDALDDALTATSKYRPRGLLEWVWVAVVAGTVGSPGIGLPTGGGTGGGVPAEQQATLRENLPATIPDVVLFVIAAVVALWILFVIAGAFLEFPFLRWLRDGDLALRAELRDHWRAAAGLAVFRLLVNVLSFALFGAIVVAFVDASDPLGYVFALDGYWPLFALFGIVFGLVSAFTTAFVVPAMWLGDRGVVGGWRRFWPTLTGAPKQFLAYAVAAAVLASVGGILVALAAVVGFVPAAIVALVVAPIGGGAAAVAAGALLGGVLMTIAVAVAYALVQVFLRYYALFVLGDVDDELDAIPERRLAVRDDGSGSHEGSNGGDGGSTGTESP